MCWFILFETSTLVLRMPLNAAAFRCRRKNSCFQTKLVALGFPGTYTVFLNTLVRDEYLKLVVSITKFDLNKTRNIVPS